jgi:hypothetical protein
MSSKPGNDATDSRIVNPSPSGDADLGNTLRSNPTDFSATLKLAAGGQTGTDAATRQFDGQNGPPVIVDSAVCRDANNNGKNDVLSTVSQNGKVVREKMECGPDNVVAYDDKGQAHRFPDQKITKLPVDFSGIPDWRLKQVNGQADGLINKYKDGLKPDGTKDREIGFNDISNIMKDIGKMENLTEVEKCRLWSEVKLRLGARGVPILDKDEKPEMVDSWHGKKDIGHALITMDDGYHGNFLINKTPEEATKAIQAHEDGSDDTKRSIVGEAMFHGALLVYGINKGDVYASEGQLRALRELRSKGTFSAYAEEWTRQFVRPEIDQYGKPR